MRRCRFYIEQATAQPSVWLLIFSPAVSSPLILFSCLPFLSQMRAHNAFFSQKYRLRDEKKRREENRQFPYRVWRMAAGRNSGKQTHSRLNEWGIEFGRDERHLCRSMLSIRYIASPWCHLYNVQYMPFFFATSRRFFDMFVHCQSAATCLRAYLVCQQDSNRCDYRRIILLLCRKLCFKWIMICLFATDTEDASPLIS